MDDAGLEDDGVDSLAVIVLGELAGVGSTPLISGIWRTVSASTGGFAAAIRVG
jgi:hypothetical protein